MSGYGSTGATTARDGSGSLDAAHSTTTPLPGETSAPSVDQTTRKTQRTSITYCGPLEGERSPIHSGKRSDVESQSGDLFNLDDDEIPSEHCHVIDDDFPKLDKKARCKLITASILCLVFMTAEVVGGVLANSLAIATDAAHLLTDFASFMISLFAIYLAARPATKQMSFGWYRAEVMGALISVLFIWVVTGILVYIAAERVMSGEYEIDATVMLIIASIGIAFNIVMLATLHDTHGHSHHSHGHSHSGNDAKQQKTLENSCHSNKSPGNGSPEGSVMYNSVTGDEVNLLGSGDSDFSGDNRTNMNVRAAFIHAVGDLLQSAGVLIAALIIYFKPEYKLADPICTFLFSVLVLVTTITILRDTLNVLMEAKDSDHQKISRRAGALLRDKFGISECTVQTEQFVDAMKDCTQCQHPRE